jgi:hypothetical protein
MNPPKDTPLEGDALRKLLLEVYYRGKDKKGYSDTELKSDLQAILKWAATDYLDSVLPENSQTNLNESEM